MKRLGVIVLGWALLSLLAPAAAIAADYPPGSTTVVPTTIVPPESTTSSPSSSTSVPPTIAPGEGKPPNNIGGKPGNSQFTNEACGFKPNSTVSVYLNGTYVEDDTTDANGCAQQTVKLSCTGPTATIDGHAVPAKKGSNDLTNSGFDTNGKPLSVTTRFEITGCGNAKGTNVSRGALAFTGANIIRLTLVALFLIALGWLIVRYERRKSQFD
jgi:hypothetical protein